MTGRGVIRPPRCVSPSLVEIARCGLSGVVGRCFLPRSSVLFRCESGSVLREAGSPQQQPASDVLPPNSQRSQPSACKLFAQYRLGK